MKLAGILLLSLTVVTASGGFADDSGGGIPTDASLKAAFIGDSGNGSDFEAVLHLIRSEGAAMVMHQGDFDYHKNPRAFFATIDRVLGPNFPYFASVGNHDEPRWGGTGGYAEFLTDRMTRLGVTPDDPNLDDQKYAATYRGLSMVFVGENGNNAEFSSFIESRLAGDPHIWKVCSWHRNQRAMQVGDKPDDMGWEVYENCRRHGAIIATAHEHSYERTKTLASIREQTVDATCPNPASLCVWRGRTFVFVSGLGGNSIRDQERCLPTTYPYGCKGEWAFIYTTSQRPLPRFGALFIEFNVGGNPRAARGYFKNVDGQTVDQFNITAE